MEVVGARVFMLPSVLQEIYEYLMYIKPTDEFARNNPNNPVITFNYPCFPFKNRTEHEKDIMDNKKDMATTINALKNGNRIISVWDSFSYSNEDLLEMYAQPKSYYDAKGVRLFDDFTSKHVTIENGHRVTAQKPFDCEKKIFLVGGCRMYGICAPDDKTISSYLQAMLNAVNTHPKYGVENYGHFVFGRLLDAYEIMRHLPIKDGDIIIVTTGRASVAGRRIRNKYTHHIDLTSLFYRPHKHGEVFLDCQSHFNEKGYFAIAQALYKELSANDFFKNWKILAPPGKCKTRHRNGTSRCAGWISEQLTSAQKRHRRDCYELQSLYIGAPLSYRVFGLQS
jgi:hypothetical protein